MEIATPECHALRLCEWSKVREAWRGSAVRDWVAERSGQREASYRGRGRTGFAGAETVRCAWCTGHPAGRDTRQGPRLTDGLDGSWDEAAAACPTQHCRTCLRNVSVTGRSKHMVRRLTAP